MLHADHRPAVGVGSLQGLFGTAAVLELAVGVVVEQQQAQGRAVRAAANGWTVVSIRHDWQVVFAGTPP